MVGAHASILGHEEETALKEDKAARWKQLRALRIMAPPQQPWPSHPGSSVRGKQMSNLLDLLLFVGLLYNSYTCLPSQCGFYFKQIKIQYRATE